MENYKEHLDNLRHAYVNANYQQRYKVIQDVLEDYPLDAPNKLIAYVSAVEAYSRTLLVCMAGNARGAKENAYERVKYAKPLDMVLEVLASQGVSEASFYEGDDGELLRYAVEYRNLLVHECTYLAPDKYRPLIIACERVLSGLDLLARRAGI
jgi:hypothetical protein